MNELVDYKIIKLMFSYLKENKLPDKDFVKNIANLIINAKKLNKYIYYLNVIDDASYPTDSLGEFNSYIKTITIYLGKINSIHNDSSKYGEYYNLFLNLLDTIKIIIHEIEHAYQFKLITENTKSIETLLLYPSYTYDFSASDHEYDKYYYFDPAERLAYIKTAKHLLRILKKMPVFYEKLYDDLNIWLKNFILEDYRKCLSPSLTYLSKILLPKDLNQIKRKSSHLSLKEKIYYGLPLSKHDYLHIRKVI